MKRAGKLCLCLAGGLVLSTGLRAGDLVSSDNPYAPIVARNVFDIHPLPPVDPNQANAEPPPKITPNGITSFLGHLRALFKVSIPARPGQPASEQSYILGEGQQQDDIEVTKIDEKAGVVTFSNHGTVQELPLTVATASGSAGPAPGAPGRMPSYPMPGFVPGGGNANNGGPIRFGNRFGQTGGFGGGNPNVAMGGGNNGADAGYNNMNGNSGQGSQFGVALAGGGSSPSSPSFSSSSGSSGTQPQNVLTPEQVRALIGAQFPNGIPTLPTLPGVSGSQGGVPRP